MVSFITKTALTTLLMPSRSQFVNAVSSAAIIRRNMTDMPYDAFVKQDIVKDVLSSDPPQKKCIIKFKSGVEANLGNVLTPTQVKDQPEVTWEAEDGALYTLIKTDPDAPSREDPIYREWHHWLVVNIPGNDISKGDVLSEYIGAGPPPKTGLHRYIYLIYKQPGRIEDKEHGHLTNKSADKRGGWKAIAFVNKHNLGKPVFGNFFQAEYDDYVPTLYKQLGA